MPLQIRTRRHRCASSLASTAPALFAGLALGAIGCGPPASEGDVLLVTIDTLRGDRWGCVGDPAARTPVADRLARGGLLAYEGRAPSPVTLPSHVSMMTGWPPAVHGVRDNAIFRLDEGTGRTVAEAFRDAGWVTAAFVSSFPLMSRFGLDRGFDLYDDRLDDEGDHSSYLRARPAGSTVDAFDEWLSSDRAPASGQALFAWTHFFDPHAEYGAPAPWPEVTASPYDAEVAYTDRQLGRLLARLDDARPGRARRIVLLADHGEGLGDFGEFTHGVLLHASTIRVPVVVRDETWTPRLEPRPVEIESTAETLLALGGLDSGLNPGTAPGLDRGPRGAVHSETLYPHFNYGWSGLRLREENGWRLIAGPIDRLYRVDDDPGERNDIAEAHPERVQAMRAALEEEWAARREVGVNPEARDLSEAEIAALRSMGYIGGTAGSGTADDAFDRGMDPESRMDALNRINRAVVLSESDPRACLAELRPVLEEEPGNRLALETAGRAYLRLGQAAQARAALKAATDAGRSPATVYLQLGQAERLLGELRGEGEALRAALATDPESVPALQGLAVLLLEDEELDGAVALLRRALNIRPRAVGSHLGIARVYEAMGRQADANRHWRRILELRQEGPAVSMARAALSGSDPGATR